VEDEPLVADVAQQVLARAGHRVTHWADGASAWAHLAAHPAACDLLLADVNMPRMSGVELVRRARDAGFAGRILMMTGRVADEDRRALRELRVDGILPKPFAAADLAAAVEAALRGQPPPVAPG
jgi:DNA-binding response OmpR family regulator